MHHHITPAQQRRAYSLYQLSNKLYRYALFAFGCAHCCEAFARHFGALGDSVRRAAVAAAAAETALPAPAQPPSQPHAAGLPPTMETLQRLVASDEAVMVPAFWHCPLNAVEERN